MMNSGGVLGGEVLGGGRLTVASATWSRRIRLVKWKSENRNEQPKQGDAKLAERLVSSARENGTPIRPGAAGHNMPTFIRTLVKCIRKKYVKV